VAPGLLFVGRPAHGVVWWDHPPTPTPPGGAAAALHLAALDAPLPEPAAALVASGEPLRIPEPGVDRFESEMYPALRRHVQITSSDGSYSLPVIEADRVVCRVTHGPGPCLDVDWALVAGAGPPRPVTDAADPAAEKAIGHVVDVLGWRDRLVLGTAGRLVPAPGRLTGMAAAHFVTLTVPALEGIDGVEVVQTGDAPDYRELTDTPTVRLNAASGGPGSSVTDWLDLAVEVTVGGEAVPFEELFVALAEGDPQLLLPSGGYFSLDREELRQLAELIAEARSLHDAPPGSVRLSRFSASLYEDLAGLAEIDAAGWAEQVRSLASGPPAERPVPAGLLADLRPYQREGFGWLADRFERGLGAVLADDMGLGKTLEALALVCHARGRDPGSGPFLVVAPASVVGVWAAEAARFAPGLEVVTVPETTRRRGVPIAQLVRGADLVVTSYALFRLDQEEFQAQQWAGLLLDEAQFVKNPASHAAQAARRLPCAWKLAMTGTPLENSLGELWSLLAVTCPGLLGRADRFDAAYRHPVERRGDHECLDRLRRRIRPVMLRRTKAEVLADLPEKQEVVVELDLDPRHQRRYQTQLQRERQKLLGLIGDMKANRVAILSSLTTLRQAALDVSLVDPAATNVPSTKLDHLDDLLAEAVADGHRVLVFSQFTRFLGRARARADAAGIASCYLDGRTRKRAEVIKRFRSEEIPVFFISLKAGGFGLNLTEADHAVLLDPWWNPATEAQAVDRIHRIGQTRKVMVHRLVARDTIEEKVMALKARKSRLFDSVMGADGFASASLTAADVEALLD
jgi:superfamily II DNA or RNA helicase